MHAGDVAIRPDGPGRILLSSREVDASLDLSTRAMAADSDPCNELLARAGRLVPALRGVRLGRVRVGLRSVAADGLPVAGYAPGSRGPLPPGRSQRRDTGRGSRPARGLGAAGSRRVEAGGVAAGALPDDTERRWNPPSNGDSLTTLSSRHSRRLPGRFDRRRVARHLRLERLLRLPRCERRGLPAVTSPALADRRLHERARLPLPL